MKVIDTQLDGSRLWIRLSGEHGFGVENVRSGNLVKEALDAALARHTGTVSEVVVDYSNVTLIGGDGPLWSVRRAIQEKLPVCFIVSGRNYEWLAETLTCTKMDQFIKLQMLGDL